MSYIGSGLIGVKMWFFVFSATLEGTSGNVLIVSLYISTSEYVNLSVCILHLKLSAFKKTFLPFSTPILTPLSSSTPLSALHCRAELAADTLEEEVRRNEMGSVSLPTSVLISKGLMLHVGSYREPLSE